MLYTQLRAFDAVARAGSFTRASTLLGLSQPAVSAQVRALEVAYGIRLFHRRGHTIRPTRAGRELMPMARKFMNLEEQIRNRLDGGRDAEVEILRIAFDGPHITMPLVAKFRQLHPRISLVVSMGNTRAVRQQLLERHVDLAVLPRAVEDQRIHAVVIKRHDPILIVGKRHAWAGRRTVSARELASQQMIAREVGSNTQRCVDEGLAGIGVSPEVVLRLGSREAVKEAVAANLGFAIIWQDEARGDDRLHTIRLADSSIESIEYLACLKDERHRREIVAFFKLINQVEI